MQDFKSKVGTGTALGRIRIQIRIQVISLEAEWGSELPVFPTLLFAFML